MLPAAVLFMLGPFAYHSMLRPGWAIADYDVATYFGPYRAYLASAWREGRWVPLWNSDIYLGAPFLANIQAADLYPPNLLLLVLPPAAAISWLIALHAGLAGAGMYLYALRGPNLRRAGSATAALVYMLGALMVSQAGHLNQVSTLAWAPWLMLSADRAAARPRPRRLAAVAALVALVILAGHTQQAYFAFLLAGIAAGRRLWGPAVRRRLWGRTLRSAALLGGAGLLGVAVSALQVLPTLELTGLSNRSGGLSLADAGADPLPVRGLLGNLLPDYLGEHPTELATSVGSAALVLTALAIVCRWRRPRVGFWVLLAVVALLVAIGPKGRVYDVFYLGLPGFKLFRVPSRTLLFTTVSAAMLTGYGTLTAQQLALSWRRGRRERCLRAVAAAVALALAAPLLMLVGALVRPTRTTHGAAMVFSTSFQSGNVVAASLFIGLAAAVLVAGIAWRRVSLGLLPLIVLVDLVLLASHTYPMHPLPASVYDPARSTTPLLTRDLDHRYLALTPPNGALPADVVAPANLSPVDRQRYLSFRAVIDARLPDVTMPGGPLSADGYDGGLLPTRGYVAFRVPLLPPGSGNPADYTDHLLTNHVYDPAWLDRAAVNVVLTDSHTDPNPPGCACLTEVARMPDLVLWAPKSEALPRAHLESGAPARVLRDSGERVVVQLPAGASGRLVLADTYYPGWTAAVDGRPAPVQRYQGYERAVPIPPGAKEVVFDYRPRWLLAAAAISVLALLVVLALALWPLPFRLRTGAGHAPARPAPQESRPPSPANGGVRSR